MERLWVLQLLFGEPHSNGRGRRRALSPPTTCDRLRRSMMQKHIVKDDDVLLFKLNVSPT